MTKNWQWLGDNLGADMSFSRFPIYAARVHRDAAFLPTYQKFFEAVMTPALQRSYNQGTEIIQWQSAWKSRDLADIKEFFKTT
jgi:hypothetical protein